MTPELEAFIRSLIQVVPTDELAWPEPAPATPSDRHDWELRVASLREAHNQRTLDVASAAGTLLPFSPPTAEVSVPVEGGQVTAQVYAPSGEPGPHPAVVHFHGGGFWMGDGSVLRRLDGPWCHQLAQDLNAVVINVDYRLAPEHRFPVPVEDGYAVVRWVSENSAALGVDPERVAVHGVSAGAFVAATVCLLARARSGPPIRFQALMAPAVLVDPAARYPAVSSLPGLDEAEIRRCAELLMGPEPYDPRSVSPLLAEDMSGLPDAFVATCAFDVLCADGERYAQRLSDAGVQVTARRYDAVHVIARPETDAQRYADLLSALRGALAPRPRD
ncbi:alpha/beta hydrolase fold domain-containing protein [Streptomyces muensis]|uniref:Alpha/beta hydrolase fold domain-containing protein n=1 Tax=Streptomyces muensis TaxID=1077944 RepID=A0A9X1PTL8_STRM4|nr:alpha/beta hydrolase fold domain-containing protein [Streptomyces muensis]MCF1592295.1 alpha/beta hydrolase fold domain-containing protein [Streptomyces muensis]